MQKLFLLFILTLGFMGFNSSTFAAQDGAQATDQQQAANDEKKKKGEDEEEPECE